MSSSTERKRVVWNETNLADNEEYRRLHPVTMKIDEPKTPYHHDEGNYVDEDGDAPADQGTWDPKVNDLARRVKQQTPIVREGDAAAPATSSGDSVPGKKRPSLSIKNEDDALASSQRHEARQHEAEFKAMRKAVYADEGAKFKQLLHTTVEEDDEEPSQ